MNYNKTICPMPFNHLDIDTTGTISPCCEFLDKLPVPEINQNSYKTFFLNIRDQISKNIPVNGCKRCYDREKNFDKSFRLEMLERYQNYTKKEFEIPEAPELLSLNVALSNLCNSKCRMCNTKYSTSWYQDAVSLNIPIPKGAVKKEDALDYVDLSKLKLLSFVGGEPMMQQDKILEILNRCTLDHLIFIVTSNATILPNEFLLDKIKNCAGVEFDLSVDAYGRLNEFLRKGCDWNVIDSNIRWYYNNFPVIKMNSVISIYNVNIFDQLIDYVKHNFPDINHRLFMVSGDPVNGDWMHPKNLPDHAKEKIKLKILKIKEKYKSITICDQILDEMFQKGDTEHFQEINNKLDKLRNEHWKDYNPELYGMLNEGR